jgi:hypothetical protein
MNAHALQVRLASRTLPCGVICCLQLLADLLGLVALSIRPRRWLEAENLFLRRQLALYEEQGSKPRRVDAATRMSLVLLSKLCSEFCGGTWGRFSRSWLSIRNHRS